MRADGLPGWALGTCRCLAAALLLHLCAPVMAVAQALDDHDPSRVSLLVEQTTLDPGGTLWAGIDIEMAPGWHTYWKNPGDSGFPLVTRWTLPEGFEAGEVLYPVPHRQEYGPIFNYGFSDRAIMLAPVSIPASIALGEAYSFDLTVEYLVCAEICIPRDASFSFTVPYRGGAPLTETSGEAHFAFARERLPRELPVQASASPVEPGKDGGDIILAVPLFADGVELLADWYFFPERWDVADHGAAQEARIDRDGKRLLLRLPGSGSYEKPLEQLTGVLTAADHSNAAQGVEGAEPVDLGFSLSAPLSDDPALLAAWNNAGASGGAKTGDHAAAASDQAGASLVFLLAMAVLGGLLLNLMPCVLPVLSIKVLALLRHREAGETSSGMRLETSLYAAGVLSAMLGLGLLLLGFRAGGEAIGWGFQLQEPVFVGFLALLFFLMALALLEVLPLPQLMGGVGAALAGRSTQTKSFLTGVLAVVAASPCTAPFMAAALGAALLLPAMQSLAIFLCLGLGLSLPFLLIGFVPGLARFLPRPGAWMGRLQQFMAFPLFATVIWLVYVLGQQTGSLGVAVILTLLLGIGFAVWLARLGGFRLRAAGWAVAVLAMLSAGYAIAALPVVQVGNGNASGDEKGALAAIPYTEQRLQQALADGQPVFVNATAAWCISCLVNEQVALSDPAVREAFEAHGVTYLKADWTNRDPAVTALLEQFGRLGVPLYVAYQRGEREPRVLPQILLPSTVIEAFGPMPKTPQAASLDTSR